MWSQLEEEGEEALAAHQVNWDSGAHGIWEQPETAGRSLFLVHLPLKGSLGPEEICDNGIGEIAARVSCSNGLSDERFKGGTRRRRSELGSLVLTQRREAGTVPSTATISVCA